MRPYTIPQTGVQNLEGTLQPPQEAEKVSETGFRLPAGEKTEGTGGRAFHSLHIDLHIGIGISMEHGELEQGGAPLAFE